MVSNRTGGAIQVSDASALSINLALQQILERIDKVDGLRGPSTTHDRRGVGSPTDSGDAVNAGSLTSRQALFHLTLVAPPAELLVQPESTSYVEVAEALRTQVNFASPTSLEGRLVVSGWGTDSGSGEKGLALTDDTGATILEVTWAGDSEGTQVGEFTDVALDEDTLTRLYAKGATTDESLIIHSVSVEFRFTSGASVDL